MNEKPTYDELQQRILELERSEAELKKAGKEVKSSVLLSDALIDMSPIPIWVSDKKGTVLRTNQSLLETIQLTDDKIIGQYNVLKDENLETSGVMHKVRAVFEENKPARFSIPWKKELAGDVEVGTARDMYIDVSMFPILDTQGELLNVVCQWVDITNQRNVEDALKKSEDRFRNLAENATDMIYRMSLPDGIYEYVSPASKNLLGYSPEEFYNNPLLIKDIIHPDWYGYFEEQWGNLLEGNVLPIYEYQVIHKNKSVRWINQRNTLENDENGIPKAIEGVATDVTERRNAEEELVSSRSQLRILVDTIPDLVWLKDPDGIYLGCNQRFERFFGAKESAIIGKSDYDFVNKDLADFFRDHDRKAIAFDQSSVNEEWLTFSDDGYHGLFETINTPMRDPHGKLIGVLGIARDMTKRKQAEEFLKETERKLLEAQKMANLGFWVWDIHSGEVEWSDEVYNIFQLDPNGFTPQIDSIQALSPWPEEHQRDEELIRKAIENREPGAYEQKFLFPDGTIGYYYSTFQGIYDDQGNLTAIKGTVQGITEKKRAEEEQKRIKEQLQQAQKLESIGRLAGGVAHDFNNMLSIILGNTEMILDDLDSSNPVISYLHEIHKAAERSTNLTRQLLAFARKQTISPKVLDLNETIEGMLKMLRRLIGENIDLVWLPKINLWPIRLDPSQGDQILANLCVNAKDSIKNVGKVTIETDNVSFDNDYCCEHDGFKPGDYVMTALSDNGCGMDKEILDNLFEPFFTTKGVGEGTGLGLATVYGIVKQNSGFINVYSEPDKGTTFRIYFPRYGENILPKQMPNAKKADASGCETILLVEDEEAILSMTKMMLERLGYSVIVSSNPMEALKTGKSHAKQIHLLITDVVMPGMNGRELSKEMYKHFPDLKCLFMSGYTANVIAHHGVLDDGMQFIQKPFSRQDLATKVRKVLDEGKNP